MTITPAQTTGLVARFVAITIPLVLALMLAQPSHGAIDPGVNYDPASPAGKEYAIPLVIGRAEGAGTEDQRAAANTPFGVGIKPATAGDGSTRTRDGDGKSSGEGRGSEGAGTPGAASADRRAEIVRAEDPGSSSTWTLGIWLAVLLPAAAIGLGLRGGRPAQPAG